MARAPGGASTTGMPTAPRRLLAQRDHPLAPNDDATARDLERHIRGCTDADATHEAPPPSFNRVSSVAPERKVPRAAH